MTDSIYDQLNAYGTVAKQRFVETFSGSVLDTDRWSFTQVTGTWTSTMSDEVDGGYSLLSTSSTSGSRAIVDFNQKRQYAHNASEFITVMKRITTGGTHVGLTNINDALGSGAGIFSSVGDDSTSSFKTLITGSGTGVSTLNSSIAVDINWTNYKTILDSSDNKLYINGVLEVTKTVDLPTVKLQPSLRSINRSTTNSELRVRYFEAYNT